MWERERIQQIEIKSMTIRELCIADYIYTYIYTIEEYCKRERERECDHNARANEIQKINIR